ncbi:MAG: tRNA (adenosine(37)-N6)-dimethylallyltransferase MiaA [Clostridiales bacterium]|nr:tRNA (adenosine(37)-N6)-dimethylallyltransferase MiaA [Clostridiales bacterium]
MAKPYVIGIVGPTASGKTALSMMLAQKYPIEIICMDSMQVYQGMDIGTAKPSIEEQKFIPHHMLDLVLPSDPYDVAQYQQGAHKAIEDILSRQRLPVLVGGTGLYLRALTQGLSLGHTPKVDSLREKYEALLVEIGNTALHEELYKVDKTSAQRLHPNDTRRVIRALEVYEATGKPFSSQKLPPIQDSPYDFKLYAADYPREELYRRIDRRVDAMMEAGLAMEVKMLLEQGLTADMQSMQGLGYKELIPYLQGQAGLDESVDIIKRRTRNYAKRQLTWFGKDKQVHWLQPEDMQSCFLKHLKEDLKQT